MSTLLGPPERCIEEGHLWEPWPLWANLRQQRVFANVPDEDQPLVGRRERYCPRCACIQAQRWGWDPEVSFDPFGIEPRRLAAVQDAAAGD